MRFGSMRQIVICRRAESSVCGKWDLPGNMKVQLPVCVPQAAEALFIAPVALGPQDACFAAATNRRSTPWGLAHIAALESLPLALLQGPRVAAAEKSCAPGWGIPHLAARGWRRLAWVGRLSRLVLLHPSQMLSFSLVQIRHLFILVTVSFQCQ
jgi:hypothetical protein